MLCDQRPPQHFSGHRFRQRLSELHVYGGFVRREVLPAVRAQLVDCRIGSRTCDDPRFHDLALHIVGHSGYAHFLNAGMPGQDFFDFARPYLIAAGFYQILLAIDDEQKRVGVEVAKIAGVQPGACPIRGT